MKKFFLLLFLAICSVITFSYEFKEGVLENGLKYFIYSDREMPISSFDIFVKTGSDNEGENAGSGISHYIEHIVAGGATSFNTEKNYIDTLQSIGASMNAYTSNDVTCYFINASDEYSETALRTLYEWVLNCSFDSFQVAREKGVIEKEIIMYDVPSNNIYYSFADKIYRESNVKYPVTGYMEPFKKISREDILNYYNKKYSTENMILVCAGNLDIEKTEEKIQSIFKNERKPFLFEEFKEPDYNKEREVYTENFDIENTKVYINYNLDYDNIKQRIMTSILSYMLEGNSSMILTKKYVNDDKSVLSLNCFTENICDIRSSFMVYFEAEKIGIETAYSIDSTINSIASSAKYYALFNEAKRQIITDNKFRTYSSGYAVSMIAESYMKFNSPLLLFNTDSLTASITYREIQDFIKENFTAPVIFEASKKADMSFPSHEDYKITDYADTLFANGNTLRTYNTENERFSLLYVAIPFGYENSSIPGSARILEKVLYDVLERNDFFRRTNSRMFLSMNENNTIIGIKTLPENFKDGAKVIKKFFENKKIDNNLFEKAKKNMINEYKNKTEDPAEMAWRKFMLSFEKSRGENLAFPSEEQINKISEENVKTDMKEMLSKNIQIAVYGEHDEKTVNDLAEKQIKDKKGKKLFAREYGSFDTVIEKSENDQSNIYIGYYSDEIFTENEMYALLCFESFFRGAKSVIHNALRGENDYVYYGYGFLRNADKSPVFILNAQTSKEKTDFVIQKMEEVFKMISGGGFTEEDLKMQKQEMILRIKFEYSNPEYSLINDLSSNYYGFKDKKYILKEKIANITKEDIISAAAKLLKNKSVLIYK